MREVKELKDFGKGKKLLLIGGGPSVRDFSYNVGYDYTMVVNDTVHLPVKTDFNIYQDISYAGRLNERMLKKQVDREMITIGHWSNALPNTNYGYDHNQIGGTNFRHTGAYALAIADSIMNFDIIYLIGFDYNTDDNGSIHYYSKGTTESDYYKNDMDAMMTKRAFLKNAVHDFNIYSKWSYDRIYNLNPKSRLKKFQFKVTE